MSALLRWPAAAGNQRSEILHAQPWIRHGLHLASKQLTQLHGAVGHSRFEQAHGPHAQEPETAGAGVAAYILRRHR